MGRSSEGQPIFFSFRIDAWKWCLEYSPEEHWMSPSEWQTTLKELEPVIARDRQLSIIEQQENTRSSERIMRAADAKANPEEALARGISIGVARALAELKPKA